MKEYDINEAVRVVKSEFENSSVEAPDDSEIREIVDMIWNGYDDLGLTDDLDLDFNTEDEANEEEAILDYLEENLGKGRYSRATLKLILKAETDYELSII